MSTDFLSTVSVFANLSNEELSNVDKLTTTRDYPKGSMIILEEEYGDKIFVIKKGTVKITRVNDEGKEVILALLGSSDIFGEMAILDGEVRSANALAQENCELLTFTSDDFINLLENNFMLSRPFYKKQH